MALWQILATVDGTDARDRVVLPKMSAYYRFQRNQLVRSLAAEGHSVEEIRQHLAATACEVPTASHIQRLINEK